MGRGSSIRRTRAHTFALRATACVLTCPWCVCVSACSACEFPPLHSENLSVPLLRENEVRCLQRVPPVRVPADAAIVVVAFLHHALRGRRGLGRAQTPVRITRRREIQCRDGKLRPSSTEGDGGGDNHGPDVATTRQRLLSWQTAVYSVVGSGQR